MKTGKKDRGEEEVKTTIGNVDALRFIIAKIKQTEGGRNSYQDQSLNRRKKWEGKNLKNKCSHSISKTRPQEKDRNKPAKRPPTTTKTEPLPYLHSY